MGNLTSPIKAAYDILRNTCDVLRFCVDFSRMHAKSYQHFLDWFVPINNRLCVGSPLRIEELLALIKARIVEVLYGVRVKRTKAQHFVLEYHFKRIYRENRLINAQIGGLDIDCALFCTPWLKISWVSNSKTSPCN